MIRSVFYVLTFDFIAKVLGAIAGLLLVRYVAPDEYAHYTFLYGLVALLMSTISTTFNRVYIVGYKSFGLARQSMALLLLQLGLLVVVGLIVLLPVEKDYGIVFCCIVLTLALCSMDFLKSQYQGSLDFQKFARLDSSKNVLYILGLVIWIKILRWPMTAVWPLVLQAISVLFVFLLLFRPRGYSSVRGETLKVMALLGSILKGPYRLLFVYFAVVALLTQMDVIMLKILGSSFELATYGSSLRYYQFLVLSLQSVHAVFLPTLTRVQSRAEIDELFQGQRKIFAVLLVVSAIAFVAAPYFIPFVDQGKYPSATLVFRILCVSAAVSMAFSPYVNLLMKYEDFSYLTVMVAVALTLSGSINLSLIPTWGAAGAAVATLVAFSSLNFSLFLRSRYLLGRGDPKNLREG